MNRVRQIRALPPPPPDLPIKQPRKAHQTRAVGARRVGSAPGPSKSATESGTKVAARRREVTVGVRGPQVHIAAGRYHNMAVTRQGAVFGWG